ncbi:DUF3987 domain-containing protein [Billgrantia gudaonensis]|nr:DUF3987 domain-containing protein [Halomonas gudaonensis]
MSLRKARPQYSTAAEFLEALAGGGPVTFQTFDDSEEKRRALAGTLHGTLESHGRRLATANDQGGGVFVCFNATDGDGRKAANVTAVRGLVADVDVPQPLQGLLARVQGAGMPPPTLVVESSPQRFHLYWLTPYPGEIPLEEFKPLQQALAKACDSDSSVCDLPRVLRLPGFLHRKAEPFTVALVRKDGPRYPAQALRQALAPYSDTPATSAPQQETAAPAAEGGHYARRALESAAYAVQSAGQGQRNNTLNREALGVFGLVKGGALNEAEVRQALTRAAEGAGLKAAEIDATLASAWRSARSRELPRVSRRRAANDAQVPPPEGGGNVDLRPLPLAAVPSLPRYPLDALGPLLGEAAERLAWHVQAPDGMAGQSVLAAAALAVQGHVDVERGVIGAGPSSLFCITVAESGERKSTMDRLALRPVREWERVRRESQREELARFKAGHEAWQLRRQSLVNANKGKADKALTAQEQEMLAQELANHDMQEPRPPTRPQMTFEEPTQEGVYRHLQEGHPSAGLVSDEGVGFFGGHGMSEDNRGRTIATLSKLWDGAPITRTRGAAGESGILAGRRLSAHLMLQPVVAAQVMGDPLLTGQGFLARFLVMRAPSLVGQRFLMNRDPRHGVEHEAAVGHYWQALTELVNRPLDIEQETGEIRPRMAKIEGASYQAWAAFHDRVERDLGESGRLSLVQGFASKAADNAARIAAIFAHLEGELHPQVEHIERGAALMGYYLESMAIHTDTAQQDQRELQARDVLEAIRDKFGGRLSAQDFNRLPNPYRSAGKVRPLLALLVETGHLEVCAVNAQQKPRAWRVCSTGGGQG